MQKWEYSKIHLLLEQGKLFLYLPPKILEEDEVLNYVNSLGKEGWELVNVVEEIGNEREQDNRGTVVAKLFDFAVAGPRITTMTQHKAVTLGYFLWFRRLYEPKICKNCSTENSSTDIFCGRCGGKLE